ncbi:MAG: hypothetical protein WCO78_00925 [Candidatus Roizmanbacteria bacterium]
MFNTSLDILKAMPLPEDVKKDIQDRYPDKMTSEEKLVYDEFALDWYDRLYIESRQMKIREYLLEHHLEGQLQIPEDDIKRINMQIEQDIVSLLREKSAEGDISKLREQISSIAQAK